MTDEGRRREIWLSETYKNHTRLSFKIKKFLFSGRSPFQQVDIVESVEHGRILLIDEKVMLTERDEFIYHEMMAHVPLLVHPHPEQVLVIGGGDGGTVREILKHPTVQRIVIVEIDEMVVRACQAYLPSVSCSLFDNRLELRIEDGIQYVAATQERFDVILVDSTDPIGPAEALFNARFYQNVAAILNPGGILIAQAESPFYDQDIQRDMLNNQRPFFQRLHLYLFSNLSYPGGLWSFSYASDKLCPIADYDPSPNIMAEIKLNYYNPDVHYASFMLPAFILNNLNKLIDSLPVKRLKLGQRSLVT